MKKSEIANHVGVTPEEIQIWADRFKDWLDVCPTKPEKNHDGSDVAIFTLISSINEKLGQEIPFSQRCQWIEQQLRSNQNAKIIKHKRALEKNAPATDRWRIVGYECLDKYEWLKSLKPDINNIATFGCWASDTDTTCSEPYALLWTLEAARIVVVDKEPKYIQNAKQWLESTRNKEETTYFHDYNLEFLVGNMGDKHLLKNITELKENAFDLSYCCSVLYNMKPDEATLSIAIENMARTVRHGGWIIADEGFDVGKHFESIGLKKCILSDAPKTAYCYQKS